MRHDLPLPEESTARDVQAEIGDLVAEAAVPESRLDDGHDRDQQRHAATDYGGEDGGGTFVAERQRNRQRSRHHGAGKRREPPLEGPQPLHARVELEGRVAKNHAASLETSAPRRATLAFRSDRVLGMRSLAQENAVENRPLAVEIEDLRVRYGAVEAVSGLDLTIEKGSVVALLGPNGAGKTTTIECVLGLKQADQGRVVVVGTSPREAVRHGLVGAMLQISGLPSGATVREVVSLAAALHHGRGKTVADLLESAGLSEVAGREVTKLSGGQAQRVRFAMAIAGSPELLFLDEPTTGMDVESRELFWKEISRLAATGMSVLFATHYLAEAERYAGRVVMLARGRLVADGTPTELRALYVSEQIVELSSSEPERLRELSLPGVSSLEIDGSRVRIVTADADETMRALYRSDVDVHGVSAKASDLDEVFLKLAQSQEPV